MPRARRAGNNPPRVTGSSDMQGDVQQRKQEVRLGAPASACQAQSPEPHPQSWRLHARRTD
jgi:hypothetical protein